jgi:hypothetical protein
LRSNTQRVMAAKLTRLTHKIEIRLHLVAESCTICSSRSRRPVRKLLVTPSYITFDVKSRTRVTQLPDVCCVNTQNFNNTVLPLAWHEQKFAVLTLLDFVSCVLVDGNTTYVVSAFPSLPNDSSCVLAMSGPLNFISRTRVIYRSHFPSKTEFIMTVFMQAERNKIRGINVPGNVWFLFVLYGCETWSLTLREDHRLRVFEYRIMRRIFRPNRE